MWEVRVEAFWDGVQRDDVAGVIAGAHALAEARPAGDAAALYEVASAHDYVGREAEAVVLYERALAAGLGGRRADEAVIQAREFAAERGASGRCGGVARVDVRQRGACTRRGGLPCPRAA
nr:tetratricopeptide repeat protein [Demequina litorisediminis]